MQRQMLKSKIHRATVTACDPDYVGSITLDAELMREASSPRVVHVDARNRTVGVNADPETLLGEVAS